jgi:medium-chain acyl-[acyl-carrier-protein] hydrolase
MTHTETNSTVPPVWKRQFTVHAHDADWEQEARLTAICNYFQEAAWEHAEHLRVGFHDLGSSNLLWVLSRFYIEIEEYPKWTDRVTVETWPKGFDRLLALRDFELKNSSGKICARATSGWIMVDSESKRPRKADTFPELLAAINSRPAVDRRFGKLAPISGTVKESEETEKTILHGDIDLNNHVNNVKYIEWIVDNESRLRGSLAVKPRALEIHYLGEGLFGQECLIISAPHPEKTGTKMYETVRPADNTVLFRAELTDRH